MVQRMTALSFHGSTSFSAASCPQLSRLSSRKICLRRAGEWNNMRLSNLMAPGPMRNCLRERERKYCCLPRRLREGALSVGFLQTPSSAPSLAVLTNRWQLYFKTCPRPPLARSGTRFRWRKANERARSEQAVARARALNTEATEEL